jgi:hypothetical protein
VPPIRCVPDGEEAGDRIEVVLLGIAASLVRVVGPAFVFANQLRPVTAGRTAAPAPSMLGPETASDGARGWVLALVEREANVPAKLGDDLAAGELTLCI